MNAMTRLRAVTVASAVFASVTLVGPCALQRGTYVETPNVEQYDNGKEADDGASVVLGPATICTREYVGGPITCGPA